MKIFVVISLSLLAALEMLLAPAAGAQDAYQEPNLAKPVFDVTKCSLTPEERARLATNLAVFVKNMPDTTPNRMAFAEKALGIALLLDPENRTATIANGQLSHAQKLSKASPAADPALIATELQIKVRDLKKAGGADNLTVAGYLLELAFGINPTDEDVLYDMELLKRSGVKVDWSFAGQPISSATPPPASIPSPSPIVTGSASAPGERPSYYPPLYVGPYVPQNAYYRRHPRNAPEESPTPDPAANPHFPLNTTAQDGATPAKVALSQSSVKGILVRTLDNGREMAGAYQIIANVQPIESSECTMAQHVGKEMSIAFNEACRVLQTRYPAVQAGKQIMLSFQDKYSEKDGGSAGTAFTLLMLSIYSGMHFDPDVAVTGDITVDGKVGAVGAIPAKIRGAMLDNCKAVSIPVSNSGDVADMVLLYPPDTIWKIQILTAATVDEAISNTRADRPANLTQAMQLFTQVQQYLPAAPASYLNNPAIQKMLVEVLRLAPNHLSARFMLDQAAGKAPRNFSLNASLDEIFIAAAPVLQAKDDVYIECDKSAYSSVQGKLGELQFKIDQKAVDVCNALSEFLKSKEMWETTANHSHNLKTQIEKDQASLRTAVEQIKQDSAALELLRQSNE
ncbi:MAG: S16 family serine protease [Chthoniobacteraceae bacterium]